MRCSALRQLPQGSSTAHIIPHHAHFVKRTKLNSSNYFLPNTTIYSIFYSILFLYFVIKALRRRVGDSAAQKEALTMRSARAYRPPPPPARDRAFRVCGAPPAGSCRSAVFPAVKTQRPRARAPLTPSRPSTVRGEQAKRAKIGRRSGQRSSFHPYLDFIAVCAVHFDQLAHRALPDERNDLRKINALERIAFAAK